MNPILVPDSRRCWDRVSLGEVMLRLDPGEGCIHSTRHFQLREGGGDSNVPDGVLPHISHEVLWSRLQRFLEEVLPMAEQAGVRGAAVKSASRTFTFATCAARCRPTASPLSMMVIPICSTFCRSSARTD